MIYGKKRTKTNIALKPIKRMAKQNTHTHTLTYGTLKTVRWETWGHDTKADCENNKKRGRGMNRSIYNECICTDFGQETRLWNWRLRGKGKAKKILHNKYETAQPETAAKDGQIAPAPYLERSFLLLPPAPALPPPPPPLLQRLRLSASWSCRCPSRSSPGLNFPRYNTVLGGN